MKFGSVIYYILKISDTMQDVEFEYGDIGASRRRRRFLPEIYTGSIC